MNGSVLNRAFQYVDDRYLDIADEERVRQPSKAPVFSFGVIAAAIACAVLILALPAAAIAANWFGLRDLLIGGGYFQTGDTDSEENFHSDEQVISINYLFGSPEEMAHTEWREYLDNYDLCAHIDKGSVSRKYGAYTVFNSEMAEKLEEIAAKYGLQLHTQINDVDQEELAYRVGGEFMKEPLQRTWAMLYENGTFRCEGSVTCGERSYDFYFRRTVMGVLEEDSILAWIGRIEDYTEMPYLTTSGEQVTLALSEHRAFVLAKYEACMIFISIYGGNSNGLQMEQLQQIADAVDFTILKNVQIPDMRGDSAPEGGTRMNRPLMLQQEFENLGDGVIAMMLPATEEEDFVIAFYPAERIASNREFIEQNITLADASYRFPDVRENNVPIGKYVQLWMADIFTTESGSTGIVTAALYEKDGKEYYDTRIYEASKSGEGYEVNRELTDELNRTYHDAENEYPSFEVWRSLHHPAAEEVPAAPEE